MKKITIADVAKHAKVSKSTVSQFLNNRYEYMSEETRKNIQASVEELNYRPNMMARSLKQKSTYTIGVIIANIVHDFSTKIISGLEDELEPKGFHMIVCNANDNPIKEKEQIETLLAKQVDGLIIFPTGSNIELYIELLEQKVPIVFVDRYIPNVPIPAVLLDNELAAKIAVEHLLDDHITSIAIATTSVQQQITPRIERINGYKKTLEAHRIEINESFIIKEAPTQLEQAFRSLFSSPNLPQAFIAANDRVSTELLRFLKKEQRSIPQEVAVVCIDDVPYAEFFTPTLTTISQPTKDMATKAASLLLQQISGKLDLTDTGLYRFVPMLHERQSSKRN